ncbi:MAG: ornithine carbamoyltransferase [Clostridiales bacterium]
MEITKKFEGRDFLSLKDYTVEDLNYFLDVAEGLKLEQKDEGTMGYLPGRTLGMLFTKSSTRTRVSFQTGIYQLGGTGLFLSGNDLQIGRGEPIKDTARVLSRYLDAIMIRTFDHSDVVELAKYADIPIINGLTDLLHPCQVMADLLTIREHKKTLKGLKLTYVGDGNNMAHSLMYGCAKMGVDITLACPKGYEPDATVVKEAEEFAQDSGSIVRVYENPKEAAEGADVLYTDVWASMGQEGEAQERQKVFGGIYQINDDLLSVAKSDSIVLHCLPAHRGEEITDEVMEGKHSVVFDEAENRLHAQKAIMALLIA